MFFSKEFGPHFYLFVISLLFVIIKRLRKANPLLIWFFIMFIFFEFVPLISIPKIPRYLTVLTTPMIIIISCFIDRGIIKGMVVHKCRRVTVTSVLCVVTLVGLYCFATHPFLKIRKTLASYQLAQYLKKMPPYPIVLTHQDMKYDFLYHFRYKKQFYVYNEKWKQNIKNKKPSYVVVDKRYLPGSGYYKQVENPEAELINPPDDWNLLKAFNKDVSLYLVR